MFAVMFISGVWAMGGQKVELLEDSKKGGDYEPNQTQAENPVPTTSLIRNMAFSQLILTTLTLTTAHAQIITRMASAYPVWMWYIAASSAKVKVESFVKFMMIYALVQGGLFASFLPPA